MSTPIATPGDLTLFMGQTVVDDRATLILGLAQDACEELLTPLPATARRIVLSVAARVYTNPTSVTNETLGPYAASRPDIYLTRQERASLWRIAGRGGAGSTSVLSQPVNAAQTVLVAATAGTYTLSLNGQTTTALAFNASAGDVQNALAALPGVGVGNVNVSPGFVVTFLNSLGNQAVSTLVADTAGLTGTVTVTVSTVGVAAPGANLPGWEYDYSTTTWRV
jgi:hypothetical protein